MWSGLIAWNLIVFLAWGLDKWKAKNNRWRIAENVLLGGAWCFGAVGAFLGMIIFRHKIRKFKFRILVPLALILQVAVIAFIIQ